MCDLSCLSPDIMQSEHKASQKLLDQEEQKSQLDTELESLEAELQRVTAKSHNMDSELQYPVMWLVSRLVNHGVTHG